VLNLIRKSLRLKGELKGPTAHPSEQTLEIRINQYYCTGI